MVVNKNDFGGQPKKPTGYKVAPRSGDDLRSISEHVRNTFREHGCYKPNSDYIDTTFVLENLLFRAGFSFHVIEDTKLKETAAFTIPEEKLIVLKHSIYEGLLNEEPFPRFTVIHEFSHIFLAHAITLHRGATLGEHAWYEDSEWQANNLTAEIMMPVEIIRKLGSASLIASSCGVSIEAATYRIKNLNKKGLI